MCTNKPFSNVVNLQPFYLTFQGAEHPFLHYLIYFYIRHTLKQVTYVHD